MIALLFVIGVIVTSRFVTDVLETYARGIEPLFPKSHP